MREVRSVDQSRIPPPKLFQTFLHQQETKRTRLPLLRLLLLLLHGLLLLLLLLLLVIVAETTKKLGTEIQSLAVEGNNWLDHTTTE